MRRVEQEHTAGTRRRAGAIPDMAAARTRRSRCRRQSTPPSAPWQQLLAPPGAASFAAAAVVAALRPLLRPPPLSRPAGLGRRLSLPAVAVSNDKKWRVSALPTSRGDWRLGGTGMGLG